MVFTFLSVAPAGSPRRKSSARHGVIFLLATARCQYVFACAALRNSAAWEPTVRTPLVDVRV